MKILQINKFLYPRGGAETYLLGLDSLLRQAGHETVFFSQKHPLNRRDANDDLFVSHLELGGFSFKSLLKISRIFWSFEAARQVRELIAREKPDIVHIHNVYHQLSPSVIKAAKKSGLPVVMTVHDYKLVRPDYSLRADGKRVRPKDSRLAQMLLALEFRFQKLFNNYGKHVDLFLAPSQFLKDRLVEAGYDASRIAVLPLFVETAGDTRDNSQAGWDSADPHVLFFGRLHESKGADVAIKAFALLENQDVKLKIAGSGPEEAKLRKLADKLGISHRVDFLGYQDRREITRLIAGSLFTINPSRLHETFGLSAIESLACGKPVIASRAGALPSLINEANGALFEVGNFIQLKNKIDWLLENSEAREAMSREARATAAKFSPANHLAELTDIYSKTISGHAR